MNDKALTFPSLPHFENEDVYLVTRITTGAVGEMGRRVFILQAHLGTQPVSWVIAKEQALALSRDIPELLAQVHTEFPELAEPLVSATPNLDLSEPLEPLFRVGSLGVGYDRLHDLVVLTLIDAAAFELHGQDLDEPEQIEHNLYATRGQALLLSRQAEKVVAAGRPLCPQCGEPIDDFGHFCSSSPAGSRAGMVFVH